MFDEVELNHLLVAVQEKLCEVRTLRSQCKYEDGIYGLSKEIATYEALKKKILEALS
jgi:hypothetical protein